MNRTLLFLITGLCPTLIFAEGCDVWTRSQSGSVPVIESHNCYEFKNMPINSIDWSCSNENKEMLTSTKKKVGQCSDHYQATCTATMTQESLANPHSTSKDQNAKSPNIPDNERLSQAKIDCESNGGLWKASN
jgi:hypothetical protein